MKVIFSTPDWNISGVNSFNHNLMRSLQARGHEIELLLIPGPETDLSVPMPDDVPVRTLEFSAAEGHFTGRWNGLIRHLNRAAPCIYVPGYDFNHSCVAPCLDNGVGIVGVVHSDDPWHYEHLIRLGRYWNSAVAVSRFLHGRMVEIAPEVAPRGTTIHYGVPTPPALPARDGTAAERPLRIVYAGRFVEEQKRVSDLPKVAQALAGRGIAASWTLIGDGPEADGLSRAFRGLPAPSKVAFTGRLAADAVLQQFQSADVLILTSAYEGLPLSLLEAMARGLIPVVTCVESGIPEVVQDGRNGFTIPIGAIDIFADRLARLAADPVLRQTMREAAFATIKRGPFSIEAATARYEAEFARVQEAIRDGLYRRPRPYRPGSSTGDILPPPCLQFAPDLYYQVKSRVDAVQRMLGPFKTPVRAVVRAYYRRVTSSHARSGARLGGPRTSTKP